jgi:uncharacterized protein (TIRG00374 family)
VLRTDPKAIRDPKNAKSMNSKTKRFLLRLLGPLLLIVVIAKLPDPAALWTHVQDALGWEVAAAVVLNLLAVLLKVVRWRGLLATRDIVYPLSKAWSAFTAVLYVGLLTPGRIGDVLRVRYLRAATGASYADGLASIAVDRISDIYVLLGFVAFGVARFSEALVHELGRLTWIGVALCALAPLFLLIPGLADRLMRTAWQKLSKHDRAGDGMDRFLSSLRTQSVRGAPRAVPLTALAFVVNYVQGWLVVSAMGLSISFFDVVALMALASLLSLIPVSVSGVGVRELLFSVVFPFLGESAEAGVGYGLVVFAVIYVPLVAYGFVSWQLSPLPLDDPTWVKTGAGASSHTQTPGDGGAP